MRFLGKKTENIARVYLETRGLTFITANYACGHGELDLIMVDRGILVFIEVRYRRQFSHGDGIASIDLRKQEKIKKTARHYLQKNNLLDKIACRFDVISLAGKEKYDIRWIQDAFWEKW